MKSENYNDNDWNEINECMKIKRREHLWMNEIKKDIKKEKSYKWMK